MSIQILDSSLVDKIAAGEVLERPAQLVKELVENSLDAGATEVEIDVHFGGREVRVSDNGCGIPKDQLKLALHRHATSKIKAVEDLFRLRSFGFRGEALSSASSVSRLTIMSRTKVEELGTRLISVYGQEASTENLSAPLGTSILIQDLFENVPARLKFLKSEGAELQHIKACVKAFGLSRPDVTFKVLVKGKLEFFWASTEDCLSRVKDVLDTAPLFETHHQEFGIQVDAYFSAPNLTLRQNKGIWIFVQGRWVQDRALSAAIMESYRNLLMHGEYPFCVLKISLPTDEVDVNVHPSKSQVKFLKSNDVFRAVVHALRSALEKTPWLESHAPMKLESESYFPLEANKFDARPEVEFEQTTFEMPQFSQTQLQQKAFVLKDSSSSSPPSSLPSRVSDSPGFQWSKLQVLGQAAHTYILAQTTDEFYMIDQHAAHERVVFERLMGAWKDKKFSSQSYLIPLTLDFSEEDIENLVDQKDSLEGMGLEIEQMGPQTIAVSSAPEFIKETGVARALSLLADQLRTAGGGFAIEKVIGDIFASMACHSVVRAGQALSIDEMKSLLLQMDEFPFSSFCPHGRPVFVKKSFSEIDREFGRIL